MSGLRLVTGLVESVEPERTFDRLEPVVMLRCKNVWRGSSVGAPWSCAHASLAQKY